MPKRRDVFYSEAALEDLQGIFDYIADQAGPVVAGRYVDRLKRNIDGLDLFSERGARRDDLRPGLRLIGFERRVTILFTVSDRQVAVVAVAYGGQDIDSRFANDNP
jgi:toxin ParE1/3/4